MSVVIRNSMINCWERSNLDCVVSYACLPNAPARCSHPVHAKIAMSANEDMLCGKQAVVTPVHAKIAVLIRKTNLILSLPAAKLNLGG
jgi:hypothetical protein